MKSKKIILALCVAYSSTYALAAKDVTTTGMPRSADTQMQGTSSEVEVTRKIRDRLTDMDSISTSAQNITIVTLGNTITLTGTVANNQEMTKVLQTAKEYSGSKMIKNNLRVSTK